MLYDKCWEHDGLNRVLPANADRLGVEISRKTIILNDADHDWVKEIENKSGAEISFF